MSRGDLLAALAALALACAPFGAAAADDPPSCAAAAPDALCRCDARALHPLQGAVGMAQIRGQAAKFGEILASGEAATRAAIDVAPIQTLRGPDGLYVVDHHHHALAWMRAGRTDLLCHILDRPDVHPDGRFWDDVRAAHLVWLKDEQGRPIEVAQLPKTLDAMPDDPYRTLARLVRKAGGYCRERMVRSEFAEFVWADFLRQRPELPRETVSAAPDAARDAAVAAARSDAAKDMDGYNGPGAPPCPKERDD